MRIRNFAVTIVGVLIAAVGFTYQQGLETTFFGIRFAAGLGLIVAAVIVWFSFFLMDRYWYHIFLKGAVKHADKIEEQLKIRIPSINLGQTISDVSNSVRVFGITMDSDKRLTNFYLLGFVMLAVVFVSLVFATSNRPSLPAAQTATVPAQSVAPTGGSAVP